MKLQIHEHRVSFYFLMVFFNSLSILGSCQSIELLHVLLNLSVVVSCFHVSVCFKFHFSTIFLWSNRKIIDVYVNFSPASLLSLLISASNSLEDVLLFSILIII